MKMDNVNKTLYIPLYGKAYVSRKNIILKDNKAEEIWEKVGFKLKRKSKSKWLAYYMAMRAAVYDEWTKEQIVANPDAAVLHIGCGLDSRVERISAKKVNWYDIDFPQVIEERKKYYAQTEFYHMLSADMRENEWKKHIKAEKAVIIMEGVSMYFKPDELAKLLASFSETFSSVSLLMDCYTKKAAKLSKYKNPINDVGVNLVYGYDDSEDLTDKTGFRFVREHILTSQKYIDMLTGSEKAIFAHLFAGRIAKSIYRMYEFQREAML